MPPLFKTVESSKEKTKTKTKTKTTTKTKIKTETEKDKDKILKRPNICYIFEILMTYSFQI